MLEEFLGKCAEIASCDFFLACVEPGDEPVAAALKNGVSRRGGGQSNGRENVAAGKMAAQLAGGVLPTSIGCGAGGKAGGDAEGMQQAVDGERVEIARVDLLLIP